MQFTDTKKLTGESRIQGEIKLGNEIKIDNFSSEIKIPFRVDR